MDLDDMIRQLTEIRDEVGGEYTMFASQGYSSRDVRHVVVSTMCYDTGIHAWVKCQATECGREKKEGVLLL
jgi:hypothetical protein